MKMIEIFQVLLITGAMSLVCNAVGTHNDLVLAFPGMAILILIAAAGMWLGRILPGHIPGAAYIVTLGLSLIHISEPTRLL